MDRYEVKKLRHPVNLELEVPGSKSITNRALFLAALSEGKTHLKGVLFSEDSRYFLSSLQSLGFEVEIEEEKKEVTVTGCSGVIPKKEAEIYVGSAGTAARFLTAMLALSEGDYTIQASEQMKRRPMKPLFDALAQLGAEFTYLEKEGFLPVRVKGVREGLREAYPDAYKIYQAIDSFMSKPIAERKTEWMPYLDENKTIRYMLGYEIGFDNAGITDRDDAIYTALAAYDNDHPFETCILGREFLPGNNYVGLSVFDIVNGLGTDYNLDAESVDQDIAARLDLLKKAIEEAAK